MSSLLARIMLALLMLPLGTVVYVIVIVIGIELVFGFSAQGEAFMWANVATAAFVATYWILLWRGTVRWTRRRRLLTIMTLPAAVTGGVLAGLPAAGFEPSFGVFIGGVVAILLWLTLTVFAWRETSGERAARVRARTGVALVCPRCGYNMTGLATSNCPECGATYTVDELVALQPAREQEEMEADRT